MGVVSGSGSKIYVCASLPATYNKAGYTALTWSLIGEVTNIGEYGRDYDIIEHTPIDTRVTQSLKGNYKYGNLSVSFGSVPADAGQVIMLAASKSDNDYSFKIERTDGDIDAFTGKVSTFKPTVNGGAVLAVSSNIVINTDITNIK
jgi:hypothetical protein